LKNGKDYGGLVILADKHPFCIMMVTWLKYSLLIGQLHLFTVNKSTWSCLYGGFLRPSPVYLFDHFFILCYYYDINMDFIYHINCIHTLLKKLYAIFGNFIIVFLPWSSVHPLLSVRGSSPLWISLKLCWGTPLAMWFDVHCMWWPATQRISSQPIDKWLVSGNGGFYWTGHKKQIPQCVDEN